MRSGHFFIIPRTLVISEDNATQNGEKVRKIQDILGRSPENLTRGTPNPRHFASSVEHFRTLKFYFVSFL
jgi:hypothetical protein